MDNKQQKGKVPITVRLSFLNQAFDEISSANKIFSANYIVLMLRLSLDSWEAARQR